MNETCDTQIVVTNTNFPDSKQEVRLIQSFYLGLFIINLMYFPICYKQIHSDSLLVLKSVIVQL